MNQVALFRSQIRAADELDAQCEAFTFGEVQVGEQGAGGGFEIGLVGVVISAAGGAMDSD